MERDLRARVDLESGPLFRTALLRLGPEHLEWYLRVHHVAFDGYAYHLLRRRVADWFEAEQHGRKVRASGMVSLAALAAEESAYRTSEAFQSDRRFFLQRHAALRAEPAPAQPLTRICARVEGSFSPGTLARLQTLAAAARVDWPAWLLAAVAAVLREPGALGIPVTSRLGSVAATTPCMMMNIVPLHAELGVGERFSDFARRLAVELRAARVHQRYRYEELKRALGIQGKQRRLFGPVVNLLPFEAPARFGSAVARVRSVSRGPVEDLAITLLPAAGALAFDIEANPNSRTPEQLRALAEELPRGIEALLDAPETVLLAAGPGSGSPPFSAPVLDAIPVLERFRHAAAAFPRRIALEQGALALDYASLLEAVQRLAARLSRMGVTAESRVAVLLPRSPAAVVAQLAVLWAGGAYVPLDPEGPRERIELVLEDARPTLVICRPEQAALAGKRAVLDPDDSDDDAAAGRLQAPADVPDSALAYVIYTSGSTGRPNGVQIDRRALASFVAAAVERYAIEPRDRVLQFAPLQFDASVEEILISLTTGATLVLRTQAMLESLSGFLGACERLGVTVLDLPTAFFHELVPLLESGAALPERVRLVIIGGEAAAAERVRAFRARAGSQVVLLNTYGPTETTVVATVAELAGPAAVALDGPNVPIGLPLPGYTVLVLDGELAPVQQGGEGELCVLGPALARGYLGKPELTARRFVELQRVVGRPRGYLTGDRVRVRADGQLVYTGRNDDELKISGHRVNPLELEGALLELEGVTEAAVVARGGAQPKSLEAFVTGAQLSPDALRDALLRRFPAQAVPRRFIRLERLPRDASGKLDRAALRRLVEPEPEPERAARTGRTSQAERCVLRLFGEVLGSAVADPGADFFALGGHSLLALALGQRLSQAFGRAVPLSLVFQQRTASALARALSLPPSFSERRAEDPLAHRITLQDGDGPPLFCIHPADGLAWCYFGLAVHLPRVAIEALQAPGLTGALPASFDALVAEYLATIRARQPRGPYRLLGWSSGGGIAHALAAALVARGETVSLLALLDAYPADAWRDVPEPTEEDAIVSLLDDIDASAFRADGSRYSKAELLERVQRPGSSLSAFDEASLRRMVEVALHAMRTYRTAAHPLFPGDVLFFGAGRRARDAPDPELWLKYVGGRFEQLSIDATHLAMCQPRSLEIIAPTLFRALQDGLELGDGHVLA
ncbi:MAG: amino acid adenylation domain-containing protein [Myxococcota bacterium]|nr:amino acid adenylation domain-containing protein [Myxococcota bacterium]